jgi:predicted nicotinamide N-methyase
MKVGEGKKKKKKERLVGLSVDWWCRCWWAVLAAEGRRRKNN